MVKPLPQKKPLLWDFVSTIEVSSQNIDETSKTNVFLTFGESIVDKYDYPLV